MILLALDTCDARGSVAILKGIDVLANVTHDTTEEYSLWLAPAVDQALNTAGITFRDVDGFAVTTGPGSFTGARIGLTAVKAWCEVYSKRIAAVSRLEVLARQSAAGTEYVAGFFDGSRNQIFAALYRRQGTALLRVGDEAVLAPVEFLNWVAEQTAGKLVGWASLDPERITGEAAWKPRADAGEQVSRVGANLAPLLGKIGFQRANENQLIDALALDANYVRRTDAEVFWKGAKTAAGESK